MGAEKEVRVDRPVPFVDLDRTNGPVAEELENAIARVLARGDFVLGESVERFERAFADHVGTGHAIGVGSGTAALAIALRAAGIGPGDEVIAPAHTYIATALAGLHAGAEPVLCDVDAESGLIDFESAAAAIGPRTAAIVPVHLYGQVADLAPLLELAREHGLFVLEDAAQAHGARAGGGRAGSLADAAAFSFYPSKNLGALGDAGMITTDDAELAAAARRWRNLGQERKGEHAEPGRNERLDTLQAAALLVKLPHLDGWNRARRQAAEWYRERLAGRLRTLPEREGAEDVFHLFPARIGGGAAERDRVRATLTEAGIGTGVHYWPVLHDQPPLAGRDGVGRVPTPEAEAWAEQVLSLPMFPGIEEDEVAAVCAALEHAGALQPPSAAGATDG